jgi:hypothetical protein
MILYTGTLLDYRYDTLLKRSIGSEVDPARAKRLRLLFVGDGWKRLQRRCSPRSF